MAIAPATLDFDSFGKLMRPAVPADAPIMEALKACPQLERAPAEALRLLARDATLRAVGRGANIAPQGGRLDVAVVVVRGKVRAVCRAVNGREISMEIFRAGDLIADGALAPETPLAHDWEAVEASTLLLIPREAFLACLRATPELALALGASWWRGSSGRSSSRPGWRWPACRSGSSRAWSPSAARTERPGRRGS